MMNISTQISKENLCLGWNTCGTIRILAGSPRKGDVWSCVCEADDEWRLHEVSDGKNIDSLLRKLPAVNGGSLSLEACRLS